MKKLLELSKRYIGYIILSSLASIGCAVASVWVIDIFKRLVDESVNGNISKVYSIVLEGLLAIIIGMIANYTVRYTSEYFGASVLSDLRQEAMEHIVQMSPDYMEKNDFGDIVTRMTSDLGGIAEYMQTYFKECVYLPFMVIVYSVYLFRSNWILAAVCISPLFILIPLSVVLMKPIKLDQFKYTKELGQTNNNIQEICDGINVVKSYNLMGILGEKYYKALHKTFVTSNRNDVRQYNMEPISHMIGTLPVYIGLCLGGLFVFKGYITLGIMVAFVSIIKKLVEPLTSVYAIIIKGQVAFISVQRILYILAAPIEYEEQSNGQSKIDLMHHDIVFSLKNVSFSYDGMEEKKLILEDVSLTIKKGEKVALVGRSGGGKSTILKLLYKHYEINQGSIACCNIDYSKINPMELRRNISLISQDCYLFPMSIADNIRIGNMNATDDEVKRAAQLANCDEFIQAMPQDYHAMVGEKGTLLSGGQKQRISIARAILKNAPIILLDEPTSALDHESETKVNEALDRITKDKTVVVVAHRLTTITNADTIIVVNDGHIEEQGKHNELISHGGLYSQLYDEYQNGRSTS